MIIYLQSKDHLAELIGVNMKSNQEKSMFKNYKLMLKKTVTRTSNSLLFYLICFYNVVYFAKKGTKTM